MTRFGPDLTALVATLDSPLVAAEPITGLVSRTLTRATFRLTLADGRVLKGRQLDTAADADRIRETVTTLARPELPRIVSHLGTALLEEWIDGEPLGRTAPGLAFVERCGAILGAIHATPVSAQPRDTRPPLARVDWTIGELLNDGVVASSSAADLRAIARAHLPADVAIGFVHRDFCRENLIRGTGDTPFAIDSGSVGIDAFDFDLARTWYRWPMTAAQRRAFAAGYRMHRDTGSYTDHFPFWAVAVLTDATLFRSRARTGAPGVPLRRLNRLLAELRGRAVHA